MKLLGCNNTSTILLVISQVLSPRRECIQELFSTSQDHGLFSLQQSDVILFKGPNSPLKGTTPDYTHGRTCKVWPINFRYSVSSFHSVYITFCHRMGEAIMLLSKWLKADSRPARLSCLFLACSKPKCVRPQLRYKLNATHRRRSLNSEKSSHPNSATSAALRAVLSLCTKWIPPSQTPLEGLPLT